MRNVFGRIFYSSFFARLLGAATLLFTVYYLYWRARYSLNLDALFLSVPLLLAELTQCRSTPIVPHPCLVGIAYIDGPQNRHFQDSEVFVIGRNENVDAMAWLR